jgi:hypothetical protein
MMMTKRTRGLSHLGDVCDFKLYRRLCWVRVVVLVLGAFFVCARNQTENVCSLQYFVLLVLFLFVLCGIRNQTESNGRLFVARCCARSYDAIVGQTACQDFLDRPF